MVKINMEANYIPRNLEAKLKKYIPLPEILAILGPRRSGKTTFLKHLSSDIADSAYITFENQVILDLFDLDIDNFAKRYLKDAECLIIDEFQNAKRGGKNLKYLYDTYLGKKIIISGSSSPELTIQSLKYLTGRCLIFELLPFSFTEFLTTKTPKPIESELRGYINEYVIYGGYPEVVLQGDVEIKKTLLQNIYSLFFSREVKDLSSLTDDYKLKNLLKSLSLSSGSLIEYRELTNTTGFDFAYIKKYLNFLEKTYITFQVLPYFTNKRTELTKNPKVYFYDSGFRNSLIDNFLPFELRPDKGLIIENFVAQMLKSQGHQIRFWRTKNKSEVDFVTEKDGMITAYEVKAGSEGNVPRSLLGFIQKYSPKEAYVINKDISKIKTISNTKIYFKPYSKIDMR